MKRILVRLFLSRLSGLGLVALMTLPVSAQQPANPPGANPKDARADVTKRVVVERPVKAAIANSAPAVGVSPAMQPADAKNNPSVKPGDVKWHANFAAACEASKKSGKPVLLLHMMGQLDKQFC